MPVPVGDEANEPLATCGLFADGAQAIFVRSIAYQAKWQMALELKDPKKAIELLTSPDDKVSLWLVASYWDLRSIALAINESRPHPYERLNLLVIHPDELEQAAVQVEQNPDGADTRCTHAATLHYDATIDLNRAEQLLILLLQARRPMTKISRGTVRSWPSRTDRPSGFFASLKTRHRAREPISGDLRKSAPGVATARSNL
jgi:hypothetical protein